MGETCARLLRSAGEVHYLDCGGVPVGLLDSASYEQASIRLQRGDMLACFSDGITEATNRDGKLWDDREVDRILYENRHRSAAELLEKLVQAADDFMENGEQADDMTIVILRVL